MSVFRVLFNDQPDNSNPGGGGSSGSGDSGNPADTSITTPINQDGSDEECLLSGDLNGDCMLDSYEACLINGYNSNVCDCVSEGENLSKCVIAEEINTLTLADPYALLEIDCNQIQNWQTLAQHTAPQSVLDKIENLPNSWANEFEIQSLDEANGTVVNLDYFSVNIISLPNNPSTNQQLTANEFLDYMRENFNDFVNGSTFEPYCEISSMCQTETDLWNSNDPLGSIIYIDITGDDGVVVCTEYTNSYWYFMTMNAPYAGNHPVSGTRKFGYEQNANGSFNFFVRGADRFDSNIMENLAYTMSLGNPFFGADSLWASFQDKTSQFVNNNGGTSTIVTPIKNRPDWDEVEGVLNGERPVSDLGCD